jgi:hypothetical protein
MLLPIIFALAALSWVLAMSVLSAVWMLSVRGPIVSSWNSFDSRCRFYSPGLISPVTIPIPTADTVTLSNPSECGLTLRIRKVRIRCGAPYGAPLANTRANGRNSGQGDLRHRAYCACSLSTFKIADASASLPCRSRAMVNGFHLCRARSAFDVRSMSPCAVGSVPLFHAIGSDGNGQPALSQTAAVEHCSRGGFS